MASRQIRWQLQIDWDGDDTYTTETDRLVNAAGSYELTAPGVSAISGRGITADCSLVLDNADNRFSAANSSGALYADLANGGAWQRPMRLNVSIDGGSNYYRVFTGILKLPSESGVTMASTNVINVTCRGKEDLYMNRRVSTSASQFVSWVDDPPTEAEIITQFMSDAGYTMNSSYVDSGMFTIPFAWMDDESPIEECWALASACGGRFYYDVRNDEFTYENAGHWLLSPHDTVSTSAPDNAFTRADFVALSMRFDDSDLFSDVTVEYSGREVGASEVLWEPDEQIIVPTNSSKEIEVVLRQPAYTMDTISYHATTAGGLDITGNVTVALSGKKAQRATMTITNANTTYAAYLHGVSVAGQPIVGGPEGEAEANSSASFWTGRTKRKRAIRTNLFVQTSAHAAKLAAMLSDIHEEPRQLYTLTGCPGDPRRNLGDRISITDADLFGGATQYAYITAIRWRLTDAGFVQDIEAIDSDSLYEYADATPNYFVIGTNKVGAWPGSDRARVFY